MNHTLDRFGVRQPATDGGVAETEPTAELPDWLARHLRDDLDLPLDHPDTDIGWNDDRPGVRVTTPDGEYNGWPIRFECAACGFCDVVERFVERNTLHERDLENLANAETRSEEREFRRKAQMSKHAAGSYKQCPECGGETVERFDDPDRDPVLVRDDEDEPEIVTDGGTDYPFGEPFDPDDPDHPEVMLDDPEGTTYMGTPIEDIQVGERYAHSELGGHYIMTMWEVHNAEKGQFVALQKRDISEVEAAEWLEDHTTFDDGYEALGVDRSTRREALKRHPITDGGQDFADPGMHRCRSCGAERNVVVTSPHPDDDVYGFECPECGEPNEPNPVGAIDEDDFPRETLEELIDVAEERFEANQDRGDGTDAWKDTPYQWMFERSEENVVESSRGARDGDEARMWSEAGDALNLLLFGLHNREAHRPEGS